ncbi:uncharacterized protein [Euwallacea similis]|uniref:uncharacterized protein n=1 Tax=Euwallacea similis TaxID=1736056 RepID=UPI00344EB4F6
MKTLRKSVISVTMKKLKIIFLLEFLHICKGIQTAELQIGCSCDIDIFTPESQGCLEITYLEDDMVKTGYKCLDISQVPHFCQIYQTQYQDVLTCSFIHLETLREADAALVEPKYVSPSSAFSKNLKVSTESSYLIVEEPSYYYNLNYTTLDPLKSTTSIKAWLEKFIVETYNDNDDEINDEDEESEIPTTTDVTTTDEPDSTTITFSTITTTGSSSTQTSSTRTSSTHGPSTRSSSTDGPSTRSSSTHGPSTRSSSTQRTPRPPPNGATLISTNTITRLICFSALLSRISAH